MKSDTERVELNALCSQLLDSELSEAERRRLEELLRGSEEARQYYVRAMHLSASLCEYAEEMQTPAPDRIIRPSIWERWGGWRRWASPLAAAAIVMLGVWIGRSLPDRLPGVLPAEAEESVARLSGAKDCVWAVSSPQPGDELARGQRLDLRSGFAEITFDSGAQLVMEGPATLDLRSEWEAEIQRGTVRANVPPEAIGFRVTHPTVEVVDLGTEFGVTAVPDGTAEVFVLKGAVEVRSRAATGPRAKSVLRERQSRRFAMAGPSEIHDSDEKFERLRRKVKIDRIRNPLASARWSFEEEEGDTAEVENAGFSANAIALHGAGERWVEGKWGGGLDFGGQPAARLRGSLGQPVRTVAFWVCLPQVHSAGNSAPMAGLSLGKGTLGFIEFALNSHPADGAAGALRLQGPAGWMVGTTPLLDGRWHHVAAVFTANGRSNARPNATIYVDGRLETVSGRSGFGRVAEAPAAESLWLGGEGFQGTLDELVIADRPLTPTEIRHLMRTNELIAPDGYAGN